MKTRKKRPLLVPGFLIGTGILLMAYPFVSNSLYEHRQEEVIYEYQKETDKMDTTQIHQMLKEAEEYNVKLKNREAVLTDPLTRILLWMEQKKSSMNIFWIWKVTGSWGI